MIPNGNGKAKSVRFLPIVEFVFRSFPFDMAVWPSPHYTPYVGGTQEKS
jgi:hypothetical protein